MRSRDLKAKRALRPMPMTPDEIADMLDRARESVRTARYVRIAVRYAMLANVTVTEASHMFGVSKSSVAAAWERMYPGVSMLLSRRMHPRR